MGKRIRQLNDLFSIYEFDKAYHFHTPDQLIDS